MRLLRAAIGSLAVRRRAIAAAVLVAVATGAWTASSTVLAHWLPGQPTPRQLREMLAEAMLDGPGAFTPARQRPHDFYFTRAAYSSYGWRGWHVDYPKADRQFLIGLRRLTNLDSYDGENGVLLTDPDLGRYPFLYAVEVGYMAMTDAEVQALRRYLLSGGFLVVDDFWGTDEWWNFAREMGRVLPGRRIEDVPLDHPCSVPSTRLTRSCRSRMWGRGCGAAPPGSGTAMCRW